MSNAYLTNVGYFVVMTAASTATCLTGATFDDATLTCPDGSAVVMNGAAEFELSFVVAGTNSPYTAAQVDVSFWDIDGSEPTASDPSAIRAQEVVAVRSGTGYHQPVTVGNSTLVEVKNLQWKNPSATITYVGNKYATSTGFGNLPMDVIQGGPSSPTVRDTQGLATFRTTSSSSIIVLVGKILATWTPNAWASTYPGMYYLSLAPATTAMNGDGTLAPTACPIATNCCSAGRRARRDRSLLFGAPQACDPSC